MFRKRTFLLAILSIVLLAWITSPFGLQVNKAKNDIISPVAGMPADNSLEKIRLKAEEARKFIARSNYNDNICLFLNMSLPSGQNRFFVYDLKNDTLQNSGLVTHGRCNEDWLSGRKYGNTVGSGCTSLGKYKIGNSYYGRFGLAFKLYGLEKTNDKAFDRFVVLHAHDCVPESEITGDICQSDGCPTVAPGFLQQLKPIITSSRKPVLMWIYN